MLLLLVICLVRLLAPHLDHEAGGKQPFFLGIQIDARLNRRTHRLRRSLHFIQPNSRIVASYCQSRNCIGPREPSQRLQYRSIQLTTDCPADSSNRQPAATAISSLLFLTHFAVMSSMLNADRDALDCVLRSKTVGTKHLS